MFSVQRTVITKPTSSLWSCTARFVIEVWYLVSSFIPYFIMDVITYPYNGTARGPQTRGRHLIAICEVSTSRILSTENRSPPPPPPPPPPPDSSDIFIELYWPFYSPICQSEFTLVTQKSCRIFIWCYFKSEWYHRPENLSAIDWFDPVRDKLIDWDGVTNICHITIAGIMLIWPLAINLNEILIKIHTFSLRKIIWKCRQDIGGHIVSALMS